MADNVKNIFEVESSAAAFHHLATPVPNERGNEPIYTCFGMWPKEERGIVEGTDWESRVWV